MNSLSAHNEAIVHLNQQPTRVAFSLLRSLTMDLFVTDASPSLRDMLENVRGLAPDGTKVPVDSIEKRSDGYHVVVDKATHKTLLVPTDCVAVPGGGLYNMSRDLEIIQQALGTKLGDIPPFEFLAWSDTKDCAFPGASTTTPGRSRTSLIVNKSKGFDKLILTERGPTFDSAAADPWDAERAFYEKSDAFVFVGQEPSDSAKFEYLRRRKLEHPTLRIFWLVGGNQIKKLYTEYRDFLSVADVVSLNLAEAAEFFCFEPLTSRYRDAIELRMMYAREISRRVLVEYGANHVVITDGTKGASLARKARGGRVEFVYSPLPENMLDVDSSVREDTGCGDSYAAAIAAYFLANPDGFRLNEAANFAHGVANIIFHRPRTNLTAEDMDVLKITHAKVQEGGAFGGRRETFLRGVCQISPMDVAPRGPRRKILALLVGGDPAASLGAGQPYVTGASPAMEGLARLCRAGISLTGEYPFAPLVRIVPRLTTSLNARDKFAKILATPEEFARMIERDELRKDLGSLEDGILNGIRKADLEGGDGVYLMRVTLLEALEVMSSEDYSTMFGDIKFWHFPTLDADSPPKWQKRDEAQHLELKRQSLRDYIVRDLSPQYGFSPTHAETQEEFEREVTEQLRLRVNALLAGVFRE